MEKTEKILIAIVIVVAAVAVVFILMNGIQATTGHNSYENITFKADALVKTNDTVFRFTPPVLLPGPYTAAYEFRMNNVTQIQDRHVFTNISPADPIEIDFNTPGNATYTLYMLVSDPNKQTVYRGISVLVTGNNATFSSASLVNSTTPGNPFSSPIPIL